MKLYVGQQLNAGLDPATVRTRLEYLKQFRVSLVSPLTSLDNVDAHDLIVKLKRAKALQGGSKLKPLVTIQQLFSPLHTPARGGCAARWLTYQALWWCIICSGCRPNEMCDAVLLLTTTSLKVGYLHRKQNSMPGARKDEYLFKWTGPPPAEICLWINEHKKFSFKGCNVASCLNSWLKQCNCNMTSTVPRLFLDNVLRNEVDSGVLTVVAYERLMGHSIKTSDASYRRDAPVG